MTARITSEQTKQLKRVVEDMIDHVLNEVHPDKDGLQRLLEQGGEFQKHLVPHVISGIRRFAASPSNYDTARSILGADFLAPTEIAMARTVAYESEQLVRLESTVPSQEILKWCRDNGFVLLAAPPQNMSTLAIRSLKADLFFQLIGRWYSKTSEKFSRDDSTKGGWLMIKKEPARNSTNKSRIEQNTLLSNEERVPNAAEVVWFITTYFAVRGVRLMADIYVRTSSYDSDNGGVIIGEFSNKGLCICAEDDDHSDPQVGLASART